MQLASAIKSMREMRDVVRANVMFVYVDQSLLQLPHLLVEKFVGCLLFCWYNNKFLVRPWKILATKSLTVCLDRVSYESDQFFWLFQLPSF